MTVTWLLVALVTWPVLAFAVGLLVGRGIAAGERKVPFPSPPGWLRRELPPDIVAPLPVERQVTRT